MAVLGSFSPSHLLLLLLLFLGIPGARGQDLEVFQTPGPLSVSAGETLVLNCTLIGRTIPGGVRWFKGTDRNQPPIYSEKGAPPPRVTKVAPESEKDFTIHVANIQPDDAGTYYCVKYRASSGPEQEHKSGRGTVVAVIGATGQALEVLQSPGPLTVSIGQTLVLNCTLIGSLIPGGVRWYKGADLSQPPIYHDMGNPPSRVSRVARLSDRDFSILIANIQPEDAATYYCVKYTQRSLGEKKYKKGRGTLVSVIATPSPPMISAPSGRLEAEKVATFNCSSDGFSPRDITVTWLKDGNRIRALRTTVLPPAKGASYHVLSTVELRLTERDVKSQLVCQLEHSTLGRPLQQRFRLGDVLQVPPKVRVESSPQAPVQLNASVTLTCSAEGFYPNDTSLVWLENDKEIGPGKAGVLTQNAVGTFSLKSSLEVDATEDKNMTMFSCLVVHNRRLPVNESLVLSIAVQPEDKPLSPAGPDQWALFNLILWIGLFLNKILGALFLVCLFLRKQHGEVTPGHTVISAQEKNWPESST